MAGIGPVHFYVTLKDDFIDKCSENTGSVLFEDLENPYLDAQDRLTPGRVYPVMNVGEQGRLLTVIDDSGRPWDAVTGLFKFFETQDSSGVSDISSQGY